MDYNITVGSIVRLDENEKIRYVVIHIDLVTPRFPAESPNVWIRKLGGQTIGRDLSSANGIVSLNRLWV